jgi:hypothetical protein
MKRFYSLIIGLIAAACVMAASPAIASAAPDGSTAAARPATVTALPRTVPQVAPRSPTNCPPGDFCSYNTIEGSSPCVMQSSGNHNWNPPCVNNDVSIINISAGKTRLYFSASGWNGNSAWMCINSGDHINNLLTGDHNPGNNNGAYVFDQGSGRHGYLQNVEHNVHSDSIVQGICNPNE